MLPLRPGCWGTSVVPRHPTMEKYPRITSHVSREGASLPFGSFGSEGQTCRAGCSSFGGLWLRQLSTFGISVSSSLTEETIVMFSLHAWISLLCDQLRVAPSLWWRSLAPTTFKRQQASESESVSESVRQKKKKDAKAGQKSIENLVDCGLGMPWRARLVGTVVFMVCLKWCHQWQSWLWFEVSMLKLNSQKIDRVRSLRCSHPWYWAHLVPTHTVDVAIWIINLHTRSCVHVHSIMSSESR